MKLFHQIFGALLVVIFLLTGQYMDRFHNHLDGVPEGVRMLFRSRHIYILLAALVNLALGAYCARCKPWGLRAGLQLVGSLLVTLASSLFVAAFFYEPTRAGAGLHTPLSRLGVYTIAWGTLLHLFSGLGRREPAVD